MRDRTRPHTSRSADTLGQTLAELAKSSIQYSTGMERFRICAARNAAEHATRVGTYCKLIICEPCQYNRFALEHESLMKKVLDGLGSVEHGRVISVSITSSLYSVAEAWRLMDRMLSAWTRFADRKSFQSVAHGFARAVRLRLDPLADAVACETNVLVLTERNHALQTGDDWLAQWQRMPGCEMDRLAHFQAIQPDLPGHRAELEAEVEALTWIGVDPIELCDFLQSAPSCRRTNLDSVCRALRGRKLIRTGRAFMASEQRNQ